MKEINVYIYAVYIVVLFVKKENNFIHLKEIKHVLCAFIYSQVKSLAKFVRILEQVKTFDCISGFH